MRYKTLYRKVIREAKRRYNDNYILHAKNISKAIWRVIHKETGKFSSKKQDVIVVNKSVEVMNPSKVAELLNSYFCEVLKELLKEKGKKIPTQGNYHLKIKENINSIFLLPITEIEVEKVASSLKNKLTAGTDEIPEYVVKQCIGQLKVDMCFVSTHTCLVLLV